MGATGMSETNLHQAIEQAFATPESRIVGYEQVRRALEEGANPNARDDQGQTPIALAGAGFPLAGAILRDQLVALLISHGADPFLSSGKHADSPNAAMLITNVGGSALKVLLENLRLRDLNSQPMRDAQGGNLFHLLAEKIPLKLTESFFYLDLFQNKQSSEDPDPAQEAVAAVSDGWMREINAQGDTVLHKLWSKESLIETAMRVHENVSEVGRLLQESWLLTQSLLQAGCPGQLRNESGESAFDLITDKMARGWKAGTHAEYWAELEGQIRLEALEEGTSRRDVRLSGPRPGRL